MMAGLQRTARIPPCSAASRPFAALRPCGRLRRPGPGLRAAATGHLSLTAGARFPKAASTRSHLTPSSGYSRPSLYALSAVIRVSASGSIRVIRDARFNADRRSSAVIRLFDPRHRVPDPRHPRCAVSHADPRPSASSASCLIRGYPRPMSDPRHPRLSLIRVTGTPAALPESRRRRAADRTRPGGRRRAARRWPARTRTWSFAAVPPGAGGRAASTRRGWRR